MLVPAPSFRSPAGGIMLSVLFVLGATLTLLPAVLVTLDHESIDSRSRALGHREHRIARFARWGERLWANQPRGASLRSRCCCSLGCPHARAAYGDALDQVLPDDSSAKLGYHEVADAFGPGAPGMLQVVVDSDRTRAGPSTH